MAFFAVVYTYVDDADLVAEHRPAHRDFLRGLHEKGVLRASGPMPGAQPPRALLIMTGADVAEVRGALRPDPFMAAGVITDIAVNAWDPAIGVFAS